MNYETEEMRKNLVDNDFMSEFEELYFDTISDFSALSDYIAEITHFITPAGNDAYEIGYMVLSNVDFNEIDFKALFFYFEDNLIYNFTKDLRHEMMRAGIDETTVNNIFEDELYICPECGHFMGFFEDMLQCQNCYEEIKL